MKKVIALVIIVLGFGLSINAQVTKTLAKSIHLEGTQSAELILPGPVTVSNWSNDFVRVTATLSVQNMNENITQSLVKAGRYSIEADVDEARKIMIIKMPKVQHHVVVRGVSLIESYSFEVSCPKGYQISIKKDTNSTTLEENTIISQTF